MDGALAAAMFKVIQPAAFPETIMIKPLTLAQVQHVSGGAKPKVELSAALKASLAGSPAKPGVEATVTLTIKF